MKKKSQSFFRLAMRHEGLWWNAYIAPHNTMVGAQHIGSIKIAMVQDDEKARDAFLNAMKIATAVAARESTGVDITWDGDGVPAPQSERSGHS